MSNNQEKTINTSLLLDEMTKKYLTLPPGDMAVLKRALDILVGLVSESINKLNNATHIEYDKEEVTLDDYIADILHTPSSSNVTVET